MSILLTITTNRNNQINNLQYCIQEILVLTALRQVAKDEQNQALTVISTTYITAVIYSLKL